MREPVTADQLQAFMKALAAPDLRQRFAEQGVDSAPSSTEAFSAFIRAETVSYDEFVANGGWKAAREKGVVRSEGKEYVVADGDVMLFRFNV